MKAGTQVHAQNYSQTVSTSQDLNNSALSSCKYLGDTAVVIKFVHGLSVIVWLLSVSMIIDTSTLAHDLDMQNAQSFNGRHTGT
jgi:hypothetical protein